MKESIDRREFVRRCTVTGVGILAGASISKALATTNPAIDYELCSVVGDRFFDNTMRAVDALGGIGRFVKKGSSVGILINSPWGNAGTFTRPDISLAVVKMCLDAGARQIYSLNGTSEKYWRRSGLYTKMKSEIDGISYSDDMTEVTIRKGRQLKKAEISKTLLSCDVYINIPIVKDHEGTRFTGNLKNIMGACSGSTCRQFHFGDSSVLNMLRGYYSNVELLAQSIADANLIRQPDLCVMDATEILTTNGPNGPGEVRKPREVIAGTNCVAADMYATRHLRLNWEDLLVIRNAQQHGYGPKSLKDVKIQTF